MIRIVKSFHGTLYIYFIRGGYNIKEELKNLDFKFDPETRTWYRVIINSKKHMEVLQHLRTVSIFRYPELETEKYIDFFNIYKKIVKEKYGLDNAEVFGYWCKNALKDNFFMMIKNFYYDFFDDCFLTKPMLLYPIIKVQKTPSSNIMKFQDFVSNTNAVLQTNNRSTQYDLSDIRELRDTRVLYIDDIPGWHKNSVDIIRYITKNDINSFPVCLTQFYDKRQKICKRFEGIAFFSY